MSVLREKHYVFACKFMRMKAKYQFDLRMRHYGGFNNYQKHSIRDTIALLGVIRHVNYDEISRNIIKVFLEDNAQIIKL